MTWNAAHTPASVSRARRLVTALAALVVLVAVVAGVPAVLVALGAVPTHLPSGQTLSSLLTSRDDGQLAGLVLAAGVWVCWGLFTLSLLPEIAAVARHRPAVRLPVVGGLQRMSAWLVTAVVLGFAVLPAAVATAGPASTTPVQVRAPASASIPLATWAAPAAPSASAAPSVQPVASAAGSPSTAAGVATAGRPLAGPVPRTGTPQAAAPTSAASTSPPSTGTPTGATGQTTAYLSVRHDTVFGLAQRYLGSGQRWPEIVALNTASLGPDNHVTPGIVLQLPADARLADSAAQTQVVRVQPGQSLWSIEEAVTGSGTNWTQGWQTNHDRAEPGGQHYDNPDLIRPGWVLEIPVAATDAGGRPSSALPATPAPARPAPTQPPTATPAGAAAAPPSEQAAPSQSSSASTTTTTTPTAADTGAATTVPTAAAAPATAPAVGAPTATAPPARPEPSAATGPPQAIAAPTPPRAAGEVDTTPRTTAAPEEASGDSHTSRLESEFLSFAAPGALLAGLCLAALTVHRRRQWRTRRTGRMIATTPPGLHAAEAAVVTAGTAPYADITWLDEALRGLVSRLAEQPDGRLPDVVAVRLTATDLTLVLACAATARAPGPWLEDGDRTTWTLPRSADTGYSLDTRAEFFAPFPCLVSIGSTGDGEHWLADLERVGTLALTGSPDRCLGVLRHVALELANSTWAEMLSVTLVGYGEDLVPANPGRLSYAGDVDRAILTAQRRHHAVTATSTRLGVDVLTGRLHAVNGDAWASHVLLVAPHVATDAAALPRLIEGLRASGIRTALAVVIADGDQHPEARWQLSIAADGTMDLPAAGVTGLNAVDVPAAEGRDIAQLLGQVAASTDDLPIPAAPGGKSWDAWYADAAGAIRQDLLQQPETGLTLVPPRAPDTAEVAAPAADTDAAGLDDQESARQDEDLPSQAPTPAAAAAAAGGTDGTDGTGTPAGRPVAGPAALLAGDRAAVAPASAQRAHDDPPTASTTGSSSGSSRAAVPQGHPDIGAQIISNDHGLDRDLADWYDPQCTRPKVLVLGKPRMLAHGEPPPPRERREAFYTEVVVYLTLHPRGVTPAQAAWDLWGDETAVKKVVKAMNVLRRWLGPDHLPVATVSGVYQLHGVMTDEEWFRRLRLRGQASTGQTRAGYWKQALSLVDGPPFDRQGKRELGAYKFLNDEPSDVILAAGVFDLANELAAHYLADDPAFPRDPEGAIAAADIAILAGSTEDRPLLSKMLAYDAMGRTAEAEAYRARVLANNPSADIEEDLPSDTYEVLLRRQRRLDSAS